GSERGAAFDRGAVNASGSGLGPKLPAPPRLRAGLGCPPSRQGPLDHPPRRRDLGGGTPRFASRGAGGDDGPLRRHRPVARPDLPALPGARVSAAAPRVFRARARSDPRGGAIPGNLTVPIRRFRSDGARISAAPPPVFRAGARSDLSQTALRDGAASVHDP